MAGWPILWKFGGIAGLTAAVTVPLFVILFYVIIPQTGFDPARFSDPDHTLAIFGSQPWLIRLTGLINLLTMTGSIIVVIALGFRLAQLAPGHAVAASMLGGLGWLMILIAESADLAAFVQLSQQYAEHPELARTGFAVAVAFGRQARGWGYLLIGLGLAVWIPAFRLHKWPRSLVWLSAAIVPFSALLFLLEIMIVLDTGSFLFALAFAPAGILLAIWNGWIGARFLADARN